MPNPPDDGSAWSGTPAEAQTPASCNGRIIVVGAGAVGSLLAQSLHRCGGDAVDLVIADPDEATRNAWAAKGAQTIDPTGGYSSIDWQPTDILVLATKATVAGAALLPVPNDVPVIAITNGILLADDLGSSRSIDWGVVDFAADLEAPGKAVCTHAGGLALNAAGEDTPAKRLARALQGSDVTPRLLPDIEGYRWSKLLLNSGFEPVAALTGQTFGEVFAHGPSRRALGRLMKESVAIAKAAGKKLQPVHGNSPTTLARALGTPLVSQIAGWVGAREARGVIGNMLEDFRRGIPSEVDYLNGTIVRTANELGLRAPAHERIVELVHELEWSGAAPGQHRAEDML